MHGCTIFSQFFPRKNIWQRLFSSAQLNRDINWAQNCIIFFQSGLYWTEQLYRLLKPPNFLSLSFKHNVASCREKELSRQPCGWPDQHSNIPIKLNTMLVLNEASLSSNHTLSPSKNGENTSPVKKFILKMLPSFSPEQLHFSWLEWKTVQCFLRF